MCPMSKTSGSIRGYLPWTVQRTASICRRLYNQPKTPAAADPFFVVPDEGCGAFEFVRFLASEPRCAFECCAGPFPVSFRRDHVCQFLRPDVTSERWIPRAESVDS